jgi:hypothetical protein
MPTSLMLVVDAEGRTIAAWADGVRIRWQDLDTVTAGVRQYNEDCARRTREEF